jgi:hypothetical protein
MRASDGRHEDVDDERRAGYVLALEGIRQVLELTPARDPDRRDLLACYRAFAELAERPALQLAPPGRADGSDGA